MSINRIIVIIISHLVSIYSKILQDVHNGVIDDALCTVIPADIFQQLPPINTRLVPDNTPTDIVNTVGEVSTDVCRSSVVMKWAESENMTEKGLGMCHNVDGLMVIVYFSLIGDTQLVYKDVFPIIT